MPEQVETLKEFCDRTECETWNGLSTAFRNGAKCRLMEIDKCNYVFREDFEAAWLRGYNAMDEWLKSGGQVAIVTYEARGALSRPATVT